MAPRRRAAHRAEPEPPSALLTVGSRNADIAFILFATFAGWNLAFTLISSFARGALADAAALGADWTQWVLMPLLAITLFLSTRNGSARPPLVRFALVALTFSFLGDVVPDMLRGDVSFYATVGCFLCAQITYIIAFRPYWKESAGSRWPPTLAVYGAVLIGLIALLAGGAGTMLPAMIVYGVCLTAMAVLATGVHWLAGLGGGLFLVSDALIATGKFSSLDLWGFGFWVMATYIAGQLLLVEGVLRRVRSSGLPRHGW